MAKFDVYINIDHFNYLINLVHQYDHERFACLFGRVKPVKGKPSIVIEEMDVFTDDDYDGLYTATCVPKKSVIADMLRKLEKKIYSVYIYYNKNQNKYNK